MGIGIYLMPIKSNYMLGGKMYVEMNLELDFFGYGLFSETDVGIALTNMRKGKRKRNGKRKRKG
jgi:hypothetical protein